MSAFTDKLQGNWNMIKGKLKEEYAELTDNDLLYEDGKEEQLIGVLQKKLGKSKEEVTDFIQSL